MKTSIILVQASRLLEVVNVLSRTSVSEVIRPQIRWMFSADLESSRATSSHMFEDAECSRALIEHERVTNPKLKSLAGDLCFDVSSWLTFMTASLHHIVDACDIHLDPSRLEPRFSGAREISASSTQRWYSLCN